MAKIFVFDAQLTDRKIFFPPLGREGARFVIMPLPQALWEWLVVG